MKLRFFITINSILLANIFCICAYALQCPNGLKPKDKKIVFFDLGETLITAPKNKSNPQEITQTSFVPGAYQYLKKLSQKHVKMALISNVPEDWGKTRQERVERLKTEIKHTWKDKVPFDWALFENRIIVPMDNAHKKPAPYMFIEAKDMANKMGLKPIFQGDSQTEVETATLLGFTTQLIDSKKPKFITDSCL